MDHNDGNESVVTSVDEFSRENDEESPSGGSDANDEVEEVKKLIREETKVVLAWRMVVIIAMLVVSAAVTTATYMFVSNEEDTEFERSYEQFATAMLDSTLFRVEAIRSSCSDFADQLTSTALTQDVEWPFFTFEYFDILAKNVLAQTSSVGVWMMPIVKDELKERWGNYSITQTDWFRGLEFPPFIYHFDDTPKMIVGRSLPFYAPFWQSEPLPTFPSINLDMAGDSETVLEGIRISGSLGEGVISANFPGLAVEPLWPSAVNITTDPTEPFSSYMQPVFSSFENKSSDTLVAVLEFILPWGSFFTNSMPEGVRGIYLVLESSCKQTMTWEFRANRAIFIGFGDQHDRSFDSYVKEENLELFANETLANELGACIHHLKVYPSAALEDNYKSNRPMISTIVVGAVFVLIIAAFLAYDSFQRRRNTKVILNAANSNKLVMSLFPSNIRDRLLTPVDASRGKKDRLGAFIPSGADKKELKNFLEENDNRGGRDLTGASIADFFLETTIMFADITNFTAWSSVREPEHVFTLLETVFSALDRIAKRRGVYKVETVGDCYVAVAGLPIPRQDHAVIMAKFARDTLLTVQELVKRLELTLGPDTGELGIRIGLHSGPVTAGVLRGDRARFQLFGDTMNTTARIETTGQRNRIHMSKETADLLVSAGKAHWVKARQDLVTAKGKGPMQTFWLDVPHDGIRNINAPSSTTTSSGHQEGDEEGASRPAVRQQPLPAVDNKINDAKDEDSTNKVNRLIDWQVDMFAGLLVQVVARRKANIRLSTSPSAATRNISRSSLSTLEWKPVPGKICLDEVKEIIELPEFDARAARQQEKVTSIGLGENITQQLRAYISTVAGLYRSNHFHNFAHACHVTMSVKKLLSRIVAPTGLDDTVQEDRLSSHRSMKGKVGAASTLHDHTYGITSDPLTQFAMVFSALIHDVNHMGVPNDTLIRENNSLASMYRNKSVAEQHSIDVAWDLLQQDQFKDLRYCIYATKPEFERFRQIVVQAVLATDIVDTELKALRNERWERAFAETEIEENPRDIVNRKATIVIEHLIQASDVAHTMQHWHIYRKWNENFFRECYQNYKEGRAQQDPSLYWYKGELGFFDFYIIPLAKKLKKCGVFGVASDEYLNYALKNRQEWEDRGGEVVEEMIQAIIANYNNSVTTSPAISLLSRPEQTTNSTTTPMREAEKHAKTENANSAINSSVTSLSKAEQRRGAVLDEEDTEEEEGIPGGTGPTIRRNTSKEVFLDEDTNKYAPSSFESSNSGNVPEHGPELVQF
ncbi:hypothetical protein ACA910_008696 [Epithemia clementina (nom. ined.)]